MDASRINSCQALASWRQMPSPTGLATLTFTVRVASRWNWSRGCVRLQRRSFGVKAGTWRKTKVPPRYLGQPSPFTHPHLLKHGEVTPGLTQTEFELRRQRLAALIATNAERLGATNSGCPVAIVLSHPIRYMTNDIPYPFHQNQEFLYLTGILEPDSALVLCCGSHEDQAILFVPRRDPARELWDGPRSGKEGAAALTGIERVHNTEELGLVLKSLKGTTVWYDGSQPCHPQLHQTYIQPLLEGGLMGRPLRRLIHSLRVIKSPAELALMKEAGSITAQAFKKTMSMSQGDIDEALLYAKFDFECRAQGANFLAYPPVVAGGNRANTLHYINNNQIIKDGELVLLDGGCEYFGYVSDITRTWPVNGKFSPAQAELYEAVLEAARRYCPHHVGHYLGMDVHDTSELSRSLPLQPGMVITIEPGLYISENDKGCPERFRGLGIRIEDDVVIQKEGGPLILSADTPKTIPEIERVCAQKDA
ncbi:xaa-Pro aminopeptidase 3 isoform X2 [Scleropages formosus]|uniref:xaa-Pro aminopeptidase 3 isoform X2 n=1 Tax=Scleropages formosus TaxID=113540 RepID=UPI000878AF10|nr:xaa-Pro aminopeptidase 3 isoform X2 [Scleropages formosus]